MKLRIALLGLVVFTGACVAPAADGDDAAKTEQDLGASCSGSYRKVSELTLPESAWRFAGGTGGRPQVFDDDGDGHLDLVIVDRRGDALSSDPDGERSFEVGVLRGDGKGSFALPTTSTLRAHATDSFAFGDFDGDGRKDVAYQSAKHGWRQVLRRADGTWGTSVAVDIDAVCALTRHDGYVTSRRVKDVDGDGYDDLVVGLVSADATGAEVARVVARGSKKGLGKPTCTKAAVAGAFQDDALSIRHTNTGDFDGDGKADIVGYGKMRNLRYVLDHEGAAKAGRINASNHNNMAYQAVVGRFDLDGLDDVADLTPYGVTLYYGDPSTPFRRAIGFPGLPETARTNTGDELSADVNGDGRPDFVFFSMDKVRENGGRLTPTVCSTANGEHRRYETRLPLADKYVELAAAGDFDEDGKDDLVFRTMGHLYRAPGAPAETARIVVFRK